MKRILLSVFIGLLGLGFSAADVEAKRLGGGMSQGMKRTTPPPRQTPDNPPPQQAPTNPSATPATAGAAAAAPAAAPRRSWLGPVAGLAAGLGIAALMSHLGLGEAFANALTMILVALVLFFVVRWALRRFGPAAAKPAGMRYAAAGGAPGTPATWAGDVTAKAGAAAGLLEKAPATPAPTAAALPPGFDRAEFERAAKMIFVRLQAANDAGDLDDLRRFSTPEMFAAFRVDLQDRQGQQRTDVVKLDAELLDVATEGDRQVVSVRFEGLIREEADGAAHPFDEVWHLVRPVDGSTPWVIAGIQQSAAVQ